MNPNNLFVTSIFIAIATVFSISFGWLVQQERLPLRKMMDFSDSQWQFIKTWVKVALLLGIVAPVALLLIYWQTVAVRQILIAYLVAIAIQLISERVLSQWLCGSVVVAIGTIYTGFRIWQLTSGLQLVDNSWLSLLWLVLLFWIANLTMLITFAIPAILLQPETDAS